MFYSYIHLEFICNMDKKTLYIMFFHMMLFYVSGHLELDLDFFRKLAESLTEMNTVSQVTKTYHTTVQRLGI